MNHKSSDLSWLPHVTLRLIIKTCSLYSTHWVGKEQCLLCCGSRLTLFRQGDNDGDSFIEIRCRRPEKDEGKIKICGVFYFRTKKNSRATVELHVAHFFSQSFGRCGIWSWQWYPSCLCCQGSGQDWPCRCTLPVQREAVCIILPGGTGRNWTTPTFTVCKCCSP